MRVGDSVWFCKKLDNGQYSAPIEIKTALGYFTVMGKSGYNDIIEFGENISQYLTVIAQPYAKWYKTFAVGDLFYCDHNEPSLEEEYYGQNANYIVDYVDYGNLRIKLTLKRVVD